MSAHLAQVGCSPIEPNRVAGRHTDRAAMANWRDFKRRKRRFRLRGDQKLDSSRQRPAQAENLATSSTSKRLFVSSLILIYLTTASRLASANEIITEFSERPIEPAPEVQPLVYDPLGEFGSGSGKFGSNAPHRSDFSSAAPGAASSSSSSSSVSPSLIEARCWNNYDNDNDCKQLNVITAPNADELLRRKQQHHSSDQFAASSGPPFNSDSDNIITPIVIFEASSTLGPDSSSPPDRREPAPGGRQLFAAKPPYQSGQQPARTAANDQFAAPPQSATILPVHIERPVTRPSVKNSVIYVATPQPGAKKGATTLKTTTAGRKCRDENDADCDEPDEEAREQNSINRGRNQEEDATGENEPDESDDRNDIRGSAPLPANSDSSSASTGVGPEQGSGGFAPTDDNDDSTDDADGNEDEDDAEAAGAANSSMDETSGQSEPSEYSSGTPRLLEVTPISSSGTTLFDNDDDQASPSRTSSSTAGTTMITQTTPSPPQTGAEIEVVVHSTLPPSFPVATSSAGDAESSSSSASRTSQASSTQLADETFTSRPIFPPSTEAPANSLPEGDDGEGASSNRQFGAQTTPEVDLYTFKPIPIPVEASASRFEQKQQHQNSLVEQTGGGGGGKPSAPPDERQQEAPVSSQHIHEPAHRKPAVLDGRNTFDDGWTTRRPANVHSQMGAREQAVQQADAFAMAANKRPGASKTHIGTDMLRTLLLYASIIILLTTALIFLVMFYVSWRRNNIRRRTLLMKAHMLNGPQPPHAGQLIQSMSHGSHLHGGAGPSGGPQQPAGLLSTYAPGKGMTMARVTTSLAKPAAGVGDESRLLGAHGAKLDEDDEDEEDRDTNGSERVGAKNNNSKEQLVAQADDESSLLAGGEPASSLARASRAPRLHNTLGHTNQTSWSTDEPTTSSGGNSSSRTQDSQQAGHTANVGHHHNNGQLDSRTAHYPNSLSDGRQNSSSLSESQCSPDAANEPPHSVPMMPLGGAIAATQAAEPSQPTMMMQPRARMMAPAYGPQMPLRQPANYGQQLVINGGVSSPVVQRPHFAPMMMFPNGHGPKPRFLESRSIEDLQLSASSSHVGFVTHPQAPLGPQHMPFPLQGQLNQPIMLPHLVHARPGSQMFAPDQQQKPFHANPLGMPMVPNQHIISPQRIAMNPLATLSRRYPSGAALNRNMYSEDSSSFMTASPSLARTSSSSSFAFNLAKHQPQSPPSMGSINSIKAKPTIDPASGRLINDYTSQAHSNGHQNNGDGPSAPPVFGRRDRSEAWYV